MTTVAVLGTFDTGAENSESVARHIEAAGGRAIRIHRDEPRSEVYGAEVSPLALRWLRKNSHRLTFFRYHDFPGRDDMVRAVGCALAQGQFAERTIFL